MLIIGLWNSLVTPKNTAHNLGASFINMLLNKMTNIICTTVTTEKYILYSYKFNENLEIKLLLFYGFINQTGENFASLPTEIYNRITKYEIVSVYDDISLKTGQIKCTFGKGTNYHNGVINLNKHISPNYWRIRIGITKEGTANDFVTKELLADHVVYSFVCELVDLFLKTIIEQQNKKEKEILLKFQENCNFKFRN